MLGIFWKNLSNNFEIKFFKGNVVGIRKIAKNKRDKEAREAKLESKKGIGSSIKAGVAKKDADEMKKKLEAAGAKVELK